MGADLITNGAPGNQPGTEGIILDAMNNVLYSFGTGGVPKAVGAGLSVTGSTAAQSTLRATSSALTLAYAGNTAVTGSVASLRGNTTIAAATTLSSGFAYGTQGKVSIAGALTTPNYVAALLGQLDTSAAGSLGTTPLSAIWGDMGASSTAATATGADILKLTNTTNTAINSAIYVNANATFFADITDIGYGGVHFVVGTTASTAAGCLKVKVGGATRYIQLYSAEA
jgi:hypothetical protein